METVVLLSSFKSSKTNKTCITYGIKPSGNFKKGFEVLSQWIDDPGLHDLFGINDFGKQYEAEMAYKDTFNGQAVKIISKLVNENGEVVFEL